ncbi:MAG: hypothetical protein WCB94_02785 [Terriglobales bacterium]
MGMMMVTVMAEARRDHNDSTLGHSAFLRQSNSTPSPWAEIKNAAIRPAADISTIPERSG